MKTSRRYCSGPPRIGITLGDVNGIGPETVFAALRKGIVAPGRARFVLIGAASVISAGARCAGMPLPPSWCPNGLWPGNVPVVQWDPLPANKAPAVRPGRVTAAASRLAYRWLQAAVHAIRQGELKGVVTAPVCKEGLHRAGRCVPGQTELLAELTGTRRVGMLLVGGRLRVILATRHVALAAVPRAVTRQTVTEAAELLLTGLAWLGVADAKIGICALNPHAGDGGIHGTEDILTVAPAVRALRRRGLTVEGPVPADVIFHMARRGRYDGVVALYHDQGLAPFKTVAFNQGVNLTLGLPFVRTSPDHGTAFDLAGKGRADPRSMTAAIRLAVRLARRPNPWSGNNKARQ